MISTVTRQLARIKLLSWHAAQLVFTHLNTHTHTHTHTVLSCIHQGDLSIYSTLILPPLWLDSVYKLLWLPFLKLFEGKLAGF
jgi:hypothetical protein